MHGPRTCKEASMEWLEACRRRRRRRRKRGRRRRRDRRRRSRRRRDDRRRRQAWNGLKHICRVLHSAVRCS
jgi:hypothetical protein